MACDASETPETFYETSRFCIFIFTTARTLNHALYCHVYPQRLLYIQQERAKLSAPCTGHVFFSYLALRFPLLPPSYSLSVHVALLCGPASQAAFVPCMSIFPCFPTPKLETICCPHRSTLLPTMVPLFRFTKLMT